MRVRVIYWTRHERVWPSKKEAKAYYDEQSCVMVEEMMEEVE